MWSQSESCSSEYGADSPDALTPQLTAKGAEQSASIHVVARFRPPISADERQERGAFIIDPDNRGVSTTDHLYHFDLDHAFCETSAQEDVFNYVGRPICSDVLHGYNGTILAYGQTGTGKTYCMFGSGTQPELQGIVPRAAKQIFGVVANTNNTKFTCHCSFLEVYKEQMRDLLCPVPADSRKLRIKELPQQGLHVDGLTRHHVRSEADVGRILRTGHRARVVKRTQLNAHSSRSHAVFVLHVEQRGMEGTECMGKLTLVDLAGSEKVSKSGLVGETLEEAKKINWSLTALGKVIDDLAEQRSHVPYRDSRLTRVLQEALGGNCRTTLVVAASASSQHYEETMSSLRFATRTKKVRNYAKVNMMYSSERLASLVGQLQKQLADANSQLAHLSDIRIGHPEPPRLPVRRRSNTDGDRSVTSERSPRRRRSEPDLLDETVMIDVGTPRGPGGASPLRRIRGSGSVRSLEGGAMASVGDLDAQTWRRSREFACPDLPGLPRPGRTSTGLTSCGSLGSLGIQDSCGSEIFSDADVDDLNLDGGVRTSTADEAWRPLANLACETVRAMETALMSQEQKLTDAKNLFAEAEQGNFGFRRGSFDSAKLVDGSDMGHLPERWRALRYAIDARALHWRLQLEQDCGKSLEVELDMRKAYVEELEQRLEAATYRGGATPSEGCSIGTDAARSTEGTIKKGISSLGSAKVGLPPRPPSRNGPQRSPPRQRQSFHSETLPDTRLVESFTDAGEGEFFPPFVAVDVAPRPVAGTGDTGESAHAVSTRMGSDLAESFDSSMISQFQEFQQAKSLLTGHAEKLQEKLRLRDEQLARLAAEVSARDVHLSALSHEIQIKDALLEHLREDAIKQAEERDEEVERLMEHAISPLATVMSQKPIAPPVRYLGA